MWLVRYNSIPNFLSAEAPEWFFTIIEYLMNPLVIYALVIVLLVVIGFQRTILRSVRDQTVDEIFTKGLQLRDLIQTQRDKHELQRRADKEVQALSQFQDSFVDGITQAMEDLGLTQDDSEKKAQVKKVAEAIAEHGYAPEVKEVVLQTRHDKGYPFQ